MNLYKIEIRGCDDSTTFEMKLTDEEVRAIMRVCQQTHNTSTYSCMPVMYIEPVMYSEDGGSA